MKITKAQIIPDDGFSDGGTAYTQEEMDLMEQEEPTQSKGDIAEEKYKGITFDYALPQEWVNEQNKKGFDVVPHFVWIYPKGSMFGEPGPITPEGETMRANPRFNRASNNQTIKLSKSQWEQIGITAGWKTNSITKKALYDNKDPEEALSESRFKEKQLADQNMINNAVKPYSDAIGVDISQEQVISILEAVKEFAVNKNSGVLIFKIRQALGIKKQ